MKLISPLSLYMIKHSETQKVNALKKKNSSFYPKVIPYGPSYFSFAFNWII